MSISQNIDNRANRFSEKMNKQMARSAHWAKNLKMRQAALNLLVSPIYFVPWLLGRLFYFLKWLGGIIWFAFRSGARME